jgi:hypothetical protein
VLEPRVVVPEPRIQVLEAVMLAILFLLGMGRRQTVIKTR